MVDYKTLTLQTKNGDMTSAYALYLSTLKPIFYTVLKQTGNDSRSELLVRDAFISAIKFLEFLNHPENFPVWVQTIATKNTAAYLSNRKNYTSGAYNVPLDTEWNQEECNAFEITENQAKAIWEEILKGLSGEELEPALSDEDCDKAFEIDEEEITDTLVALARKKAHINKRNSLIAFAIIVLILVALLISGLFPAKQKNNQNSLDELYQDVSGSLVTQFANKLSGQLDGQIGEIYQISDNTYYLLIYVNNQLAQSMLVEKKENVQSGEDYLHVISKTDEPISKIETELIKKDQYLNLDYKSNDNAIKTALKEAGTTDLKAKGNSVNVDKKALKEALSDVANEKQQLQRVFGISNNSPDLNIVLTVNCKNIDLNKPITITIDPALAEMLGDYGEIKIKLNDDRHWLLLTKEDINNICKEYSSLGVVIKAENNRIYNIEFKDSSNNVIQQLPGNIEVGIPCEHQSSYVYATYSNDENNNSISGESKHATFDPETKTICFNISNTGKYELIGEETSLFDIGNLSEEEQKAIEFIASTNCIPTESEGYFNPNGTITRGTLIEAFGKLFLTTNTNYKVNFGDIKSDDPYYDYIAAGWNNAIINGNNRGDFDSNTLAHNEDLLVLCARTLVHNGHCNFPEDNDTAYSLITYDDKNSISKFAVTSVATVIEEKIVSGEGNLYPKNNATRAFAALVLYRMYMLEN